MNEPVNDLLDAERFVREAASELKVLQERGASLAAARRSLEASVQAFADAARDLRESETLAREARARLDTAVQAIEKKVGDATAREAARLAATLGARFQDLQTQLLESDRTQREAFGVGIRGAVRSLSDSAQTLSEATHNLTANASLVEDVGMREREQWQMSVAKALGDARIALEGASDTTRRAADRLDGTVAARLSDFDRAAQQLLTRLAGVDESLEQVRAQNRASYVQQLRGELGGLRKTMITTAIIQAALIALAAIVVALR